MALVFHWSWTIEVVRDKLKRCAMGVQMDGAAMRKNQCGKPSVPRDVVDNLSNNLKIWNSWIPGPPSVPHVSFLAGST